MEDVIKRLIEYESESFKLDYKTEQYQLGKIPKKGNYSKILWLLQTIFQMMISI